MTIENRLKELILSRHGSVKSFADACGLPYGTVDTILRRGVNKASITNIIKICKTLKISTDELALGRITAVARELPEENRSKEITEILRNARNSLDEYSGLTLNGVAMSKEEIDTLLNGIEVTLWIIKNQRNREQ